MASPARQTHLLARSAGLLTEQILTKTVLLAGAGSVGSYLAELLVRSGVTRLTLIDPDTVAAENLGRSNFEARDLGQPKVESLARRLTAVNPDVELQLHASRLEDLGGPRLHQLVQDADVVVGAVDSNRASSLLCRFAYWNGVPSLHLGIWARGSGGEVVISAPPGPCYLCATAMRHAVEDVAPGTLPAQNYGLGRAVAVNALVTDVQHVTSAGAKLALGLLSDEPELPARRLVDAALDAGWTFLVLGNDPQFWAFPQLLAGVPGQLAFQSVWTGAERNSDCSVCGPDDTRVDPASVSTTGLSTAALAALDRDGLEQEQLS